MILVNKGKQMDKKRISYPREMLESAKRDGKELVTLSACGVTLQNAVDKATADRVLEFMIELMEFSKGETN